MILLQLNVPVFADSTWKPSSIGCTGWGVRWRGGEKVQEEEEEELCLYTKSRKKLKRKKIYLLIVVIV